MPEAVAVVGYACRFPGAPDAEAFWELLADGREALTRFTDDELAARGVPAALRRNPSYQPVGGLLPDQDRFDPLPFGIGEAEATALDPQQRVFLECAWHALDHAGHGGARFAGSVGVFAGSALSGYLLTNLAHRFDPLGGADPVGSLELHTANVADYLPLRTAYRLGLTGPAIAVGATCATSLVAVHQAAQSLLIGECDAALAGGVSLRVPQGLGYLHVPDGPFAADGRTHPYSADAQGTVFTQGAGVVVLRRLSDALADGDHVHAVIRGSAVGNDGAERAGFTAPSSRGQAATVAEAFAVAGIDPRTVSYVEGHGTGTILGDPIEVEALHQVFGRSAAPWCGLGSVKGNIGHADSASGVAGLIKVLLALRHRTLPASLHAEPLNPALALEGSALRVLTEAERWTSDGPRRAGVSSFGIGGVNCHVVLEEAPDTTASAPDERAQLLLVSAAGEEACRAGADALAGAVEHQPLADVAYTLATGRAELPVRAAVAVAPGESAARALRRALPVASARTAPRVVFAFPGGGAQFAGMAAGLYREEPVFARVVDEVADLVAPVTGCDLRDVLSGDASASARDPLTGLPALFAVSLGTARLLRHWGVEPDVVLGHSVGEYAAAVVAGALSTADAAVLVATRSTLMASLPKGAMLVVPSGEREVRALLDDEPELDLAAINAPDACAVSGPRDVVERVRRVLVGRGVDARVVGVDVAAHSRLVEPAMAALRAVAAKMTPCAPRLPLVTTLTGRFLADHDPEHWVRHLRGTVRFAEALDTAIAGGPSVVVQVGPGGMIPSLAARYGTAVSGAVTTFPREDEGGDDRAALLDAVGALWARGVPIEHHALHAEGRRRVPLPGYAFQRRRFWADPPRRRGSGASAVRTVDRLPDLAEPIQVPTWSQLPPVEAAGSDSRRWAVLGSGPLVESVRDEFTRRGHTAVDAVDERIDGVVWVAGHGEGAVAEVLREEVLSCGRLLAALPDGERAIGFLQVTVAGEQVVGDEIVDPVAAAVRALPRVAAQEAPVLRWRTLDLPSASAAPVVDEAVDLLAGTDDGCWELALRGGRRWIRQWEPWQPASAGPDLPDEPVVVVLGGVGNVGVALAERLCVEHDAHVVLASRSGVSDRAVLLAAAGHDVRVAAVDATRVGEVGSLLADVARRHGRVDLVVHAPVVVTLSALSEVDGLVTEEVLAPKVAGAVAVHVAIGELPPTDRPRLVVLMSSAAGTIGGFGLGAYAVASRFLDGFAHTAGTPGTRWVAVDWDRWRFGTAQERESTAEITMRHALDAPAAVDALLRVVGLTGSAPAHLAVSPAELNSRSVALARRAVHAASGGEPLGSAAEQIVAAVWSDTLGRPITGRDDDFFALGGHSLLATRVLARLRDEHGITVKLRDMLARPTVAALAELVARETRDAPSRGAVAPVPIAVPGEPFPLTRVQHAYWLGRSTTLDLGAVGCHFYLEHECAELDVERYQHALNLVIERHEMLRAVVTADGRNLVLPQVPRYRVPVHDLSAVAHPDELDERLLDLRASLSHRVARPDRWPLIETHVVRLPEGAHRVLVSVDVLVCDSASYLILDRELRTLYLDPAADLPPIGTTFADSVAALEARTGTPEHEEAARYWRQRLPALPDAPPLPVLAAEGKPSFRRLRHVLPARQWQFVRDRAAALGVTPTAVLLTAYADVLAQWSDSEHFCLTLTVFDRPPLHPDVDKVIGEFSSLLLFEVDRRGLLGFAERAHAAQRRLFDDLDHRSFTGLEVLGERARMTGVQGNVPVVFTGMLGLDAHGGAPHDHEWLGPIVHGVSQTPQVWLDHQVYEHQGDLVLQWDVAETSLDLDAATAAFAAYTSWLTALADDGTLWSAPQAGPAIAAEQERPDGLVAIWAELLDLDPADVPPDVPFVSLGGDSLLAVRMAAFIRQRLGVLLALTEIRADLTLTELADLVRERATGEGASRSLDIRVNRRMDPAEPFGMLPLQQAYFVGQEGGWELSYPSAHVYTDIGLSDVDGETAGEVLADALRRVVAHQPMLRARILPDGTQHILPVDHPEAVIPLRVNDLRGAAQSEIDAGIAGIRAGMGLRGPSPAGGPGAEMVLTLLPGGRGRLHTSFSLLVADGWSLGLFDRELITFLSEPNAVLPPASIDFGDYVDAMDRLRDTEEWRADRDWWSDRLAELPPAPAVPLVLDPDVADAQLMGSREDRLGAAEWAGLRESCAEHGVTPSAVLLAVYAIALGRLAGQHRFLLNSLRFSRVPLHPDVDRMIGPFSATALLSVELTDGLEFLEQVHAMQREVGDCAAHNLVSGVEVARELSRLRGSRRPVAPVVFQSTLGMDSALGGDRPATAGPLGRLDISDYHQQLRTPQVYLELRVFELRDELVINTAVVEELFGPGVVDDLFARIVGHTRDLAAGIGWSQPVDVPRGQVTERAEAVPGARVEAGAPRGALESAVGTLWGDLLGLSAVDRADDFFALGGDSLLAVRMLRRLADQHGARVAPATFLSAPTVAELAAAVERDVVVPLKQGTGTPLFLLHPSGGDVLCYADLARRLTAPNPVFALTDPGLSGGDGPRDIPEMVARYAEALRVHQPHGPYLLGGWSMGGTVAHDVARTLREQGAEVALLVLIDSNSPDRIVAIEGLDQERTDEELRLRYLRSVEAFLELDFGDVGGDELEHALRGSGVLADQESLRTRIAVFVRHLRALADHRAGKLDDGTPVLLLRAGAVSPRNSRVGMGVDDSFDEPDLGWGPDIGGPLDVVEIDAHHYTILHPPAVRQVAEHLSQALARYPEVS